MNEKPIIVQSILKLPIEKVWETWTLPEHITNWNFASPEWHCPRATNDLRVAGHFSWRMEAKDGSMGFDYCGKYDQIIPHKHISWTLDDGRKVTINFSEQDGQTHISETFEIEDINSADLQRKGWQAILNNFKKYAKGLH